MGFGSMIHRSTTNTVRKQDQIRVEDHLDEIIGSRMVMNPDGTCDIIGNVRLYCLDMKSLKQLTPKIRKVSGWFDCSENELTDLVGSPEYVGDSFYCNNNCLVSLEGAPKEVGGGFFCEDNNLLTLNGVPNEIGGNFYCSRNKNLKSLEGGPKIVKGTFDCSHTGVENLKGCPEEIEHDFYCNRSKLKSPEGIPEKVGGSIHLEGNPFQFTM